MASVAGAAPVETEDQLVIGAINFWWLLGDVVLIAVVAPTVVMFLNKVYRPVVEIQAYAHDILEHGVGITAGLDSVPKLGRTRELAGQARQAATRYANVLQRIAS
jgi:hypothetical protein